MAGTETLTTVPTPGSALAWGVTTVVATGDSTRGYVNGVLQTSLTGSTTQPLELSLGGYLGPTSAPSMVDVGEVLIYHRVLSDEEVAAVQGYLAYKWRVASLNGGMPSVAVVSAAGFTTDVYNTFLVQQQFMAQATRSTAFVTRTFSFDIDSTMLLTFSLRVQRVGCCGTVVSQRSARCWSSRRRLRALAVADTRVGVSVCVSAGAAVLGHRAVGAHH
jgi:hypothetical protein